MTPSTFRRIAGVLFVSLALGLGFVAGLLTATVIQPVASSDPSASARIEEAWQLIESHFLNTLPPTQTRAYAAIRGLLDALNDPYTVLIEPPAARLENDQLRGQFGGIGADLRRDADGRTLLAPYPDGPSARAGVVDGDQLMAIEAAPIQPEQRLDEIETQLRGDIGSRVRLALARNGQTFEIEIERVQIAPPSTTWRIIDNAPEMGYISIRVFTDRTVTEVRQAVDELRRRGAHALILDVRDNGGGLLQSAIDVTGQFVAGVVMIERQREGGERQFTVPPGGAALDLPLVVLVNHSTASASEILAGALRDRERAILIGEHTFGKGSVQSIYSLADGSSLHITTAEWFTPKRTAFNGRGLLPDIEVARTAEDQAIGRDPVLDRAIAYLQTQP
ncbi:MAG TPA: S41 family peptidase [Anaerolineae bacterium]|nr:S41 family peptidase [Anaerolineae bacterium]